MILEDFIVWILNTMKDVFCKNVFFKDFTKFAGRNLCQNFFLNKVAGLGHRHFLLNFTKYLKRAKHYQINQIRFI